MLPGTQMDAQHNVARHTDGCTAQCCEAHRWMHSTMLPGTQMDAQHNVARHTDGCTDRYMDIIKS